MKKAVMILSDDARFSRLLSLELADIGIETVAESRVPSESDEIYAIIDLDNAEKYLLPENISFKMKIGFTKSDDYAAETNYAKCSQILHRPFPMNELYSLLGHKSNKQKTIKASSARLENKHNQLEVDSSKNAIWGDTKIPLSENEYKILSALCANRGKIVEREKIRSILAFEDGNMGDVYICHLRRKIDNKLGLKLIYTVRGKGYMLKS